MQCLVRVDVPNARNQGLVEQRGLHVPRAAAQPIDRRTGLVESIGPKLAVPSIEHRLDALVRDDPAEPPRITEHQKVHTAPGQRPRDVTMRRGRLARDEQLPRHSELHDEGAPVISDDGKLLPASLERSHSPTDEEFPLRGPRLSASWRGL